MYPPPAPVSPRVDIPLCWTDEELCMFLEKTTHGSPLPGNVFADINPYAYNPSNLPDGIWFFVRLEDKKDTEHGFWKVKGEACEIFTNSLITGWRSTLDFYEGQAPCEQKTHWMMHEYKIIWKEQCKNSTPKESGSLCRVFRSDEHNLNHETCSKPSVPVPDDTPKVNKKDDNPRQLAVAEIFPNFPDDILTENECILRGDYLELDDLARSNAATPSSLSDNSSCLSWSSDEYFDSLLLLRDLEEKEEKLQAHIPNINFSACASARPNDDVVLAPSISGALVNAEHSETPIPENLNDDHSRLDSAIREKVVDNGKEKLAIEGESSAKQGCESTLKFHDGAAAAAAAASASSSSSSGGKQKGGSVGRRVKKGKRKYLCFIPF